MDTAHQTLAKQLKHQAFRTKKPGKNVATWSCDRTRVFLSFKKGWTIKGGRFSKTTMVKCVHESFSTKLQMTVSQNWDTTKGWTVSLHIHRYKEIDMLLLFSSFQTPQWIHINNYKYISKIRNPKIQSSLHTASTYIKSFWGFHGIPNHQNLGSVRPFHRAFRSALLQLGAMPRR